MAQIIKHRRGTLAELNGVTLNNGELGIVTSSVASIGDAVLKTAIVVGNTDGTNRLSIGRIIKGNATPNLSGITGGSAFNDMLYHETDAKTLKVLNTGGNTSLDLTGNIADGTVGGTLTTTGNLSVQAHISASGKITGSDVYASGGFYGDGSNLTGVAQDIDTLSSYGAATIHQTDDEFLISDDGTEKKITFSNLEDSIFANVSGDATIAAGGALTIAATSVEGSMLNTNVISGQTAMTGDLADTDELMVSDAGTVKRADFSVVRDAVFNDVSGDATIADGGALTIAATSVENSMLADNAVDSDELTAGSVDDAHLSDGVATGLAGAGMTATSGVLNVIGTAGAVSVGADAVTLVAANTTLTSILNASLGKIGTAAAQEYVTFGTANEVNTFINNTERLSVTSAGIDVTGNATISGNLTVNGTQTTISSSIVDIGDNIIQVNGTPVTYGGLHVKDATGNQTGSMVWDTVNNYWMGGISGSEYRVPELSTATELSANNNRVLISDGTRIDASAAITDDGTTVDISNRVDAQASLQVTGSIYASAGASVAASSASLVSFRNDSTTQLGYLASADTQAVTTGLVGYNTSTGNLTISSVVDGGSF